MKKKKKNLLTWYQHMPNHLDELAIDRTQKEQIIGSIRLRVMRLHFPSVASLSLGTVSN